MLAFLPVMLGVGSDMPIQAAYPGRRRTLIAATAASAAGFAALALSPLPFVRELGLALAAGVAISTALALVFRRSPAEAASPTGVPDRGNSAVRNASSATAEPSTPTGVVHPRPSAV